MIHIFLAREHAVRPLWPESRDGSRTYVRVEAACAGTMPPGGLFPRHATQYQLILPGYHLSKRGCVVAQAHRMVSRGRLT